MTKTLAKSLHTVTVLRRVAEHHMTYAGCNVDLALRCALDVLGLSDLEDSYGLVQQAKAQIIRAAGGAA